jgi:hypothetical protein
MPFIGQQPVTGAYHKLDSITTSATATYNLLLNGGAYSPASANHLLVSLNGVMQAPQDSFTVSGSQITFASALTSSDSIDFIMALGDVLSVGVPSDGSVNTSQLANSAVTTAKIGASQVTDAKIAGMASSKLTGALPALDGSALTGIDAMTWQSGAYVSTSTNTTEFTSLPAKDYFIAVWHDLSCDGTNWSYIRLGDATGGYATSGYAHSTSYNSGNSYYSNAANVAAHDLGVSMNWSGGTYSGVFQCWNTIGNIWTWKLHNQRTDNGANSTWNSGSVALSGQLDRIAFLENNANWTSGAIRLGYM